MSWKRQFNKSIKRIELKENCALLKHPYLKLRKKLETGKTEREGRVWMTKASQAEKERKREEKRQLKIEAKKKAQAAKTPEDIALEPEAAFHVRVAKRARLSKNTRIRAVVENENRGGHKSAGRKKVKANSSLRDIPMVQSSSKIQKPTNKKFGNATKKKGFTSALPSVSTKSVKAARHGPQDSNFQKARVAHRLKTKKR